MVLSDFAVKHPAVVTILLAVLVVFGLIAGFSMNAEMIPPTALPEISVVTTYPGAAARDVERDISRVIENQLSTLAGVSELKSSSSDSYSVVSLSFRADVRPLDKLPQLRELLNAVLDQLPDGVEGAPVIYVSEASAFLPIFSVRVESEMGLEALTEYLDERVSPAIARIPGVSRIAVVGGGKTEARVRLRSRDLEARGLSALQVYEALRYANMNVPAGTASFRDRELSFTAFGAFSGFDDLGGLAVGYADGSPIFLRDVAEVGPAPSPPRLRIRSEGRDYVMLDILKRDEGDTLRIVGEAKRVLDEVGVETRGAVRYAVISDQSETTRRSLNTVLTAALTGLALTVVVILVTLHDLRATLIISVSIPLSVLFAILGLYGTGRSLNLLSLSGMTVAIGMIVDNAIVVLENTYRRFKAGGDRRLAAMKGAGEVGGAVLASTTTSICVFAPLLFLTGIIGVIMNDLSLAIVFSLAASALVGVVVVPWLSALILKPDDQIKKPRLLRRIEAAIDRALDGLEGFYRRALAAALANKGYALAIAAAFLVASAVLLSMLTVSFLPPTDTGEFEIHVETPRGYSLARTSAAVDAVDGILRRAVPEIEAAVFYVGAGSALAITATPNQAFGRIRLVPSGARDRTIQEILPLVQEALSSGVPDADITVLNGGFDALLALGTGGQGFQMEIYGPNLEAVTASAQEALRILERDPAVFKAELSVRTDAQQLYADLSQVYMGRLGVSPYEAGVTSRILFAGMQAGRLRAGDEDFDIRLESDLTDAPVTEDTLNAIVLRTRDGRRLSFSAFSTMEARPALSRIDRRNRSFSVDVRGYLRGEDQGGVTARMNAAMAAAALPAGVRYRVSGTSELIGDSMRSLVFMLAISVFLVYSVMVIQFERFMQPLIIMAAIPFCMIGVALGLYLFGSGLSIIAMLAIIALGGTVVNNAIVLVDYTNQLRRDYGMERRAAVIQGAGARLRPILMTALTTIFGVLPMALAAGNGSEVYAPLGQAIFGGLISSTLITLVIVPLLYDSLEKRVAYIPAAHPGGALEGQHYEAPHVE